MIFLLIASMYGDKLEIDLKLYSRKTTRIEWISWGNSIVLDSYTTYNLLQTKKFKEGNPIFRFNDDTSYIEILTRVAVTDLIIQYGLRRFTKKNSIRVHIGLHYVAASWNFSKFKLR